MKRCKFFLSPNGFKCGSYAFNLDEQGIDHGEFCDVHYWQNRCEKAEAAALSQPAASVDVQNLMTPPYTPVATVDGEGRIAWHAPIPEEGGNLYCEGDLADAIARRVRTPLTEADAKAIWSQIIGWDGDRLHNFSKAIEAIQGIDTATPKATP